MTIETSSTELAPIVSDFAADPDYREVIEQFVRGMPEKIADPEYAHETGNRQELRTLAHRLKGSGGSYGFKVFTSVAADLEIACKADDSDRIDAMFRRLIAVLQRVSL